MTTPAGRRLRVVPPLPGQLSLDLPGIPTAEQIADQVAELAAARTTRRSPAPAGGAGERGEPVRPRRLLPSRDVDDTRPVVVARVPVAVWAVWDAEDLVGVYAEEAVARADAAVLRRDAARAGQRGSIVDCLPLQVLTEPQQGSRPRSASTSPARPRGADRPLMTGPVKPG